jgi:hypothetical protein
MTPFGRAMAAPMTLPSDDVVPPTPPIPTGIVVSAADGFEKAWAQLAPYADNVLQTVTVAPGTYLRSTSIKVPSGVFLEATGCTIRLMNTTTNGALLCVDNAADVTINGGTWDGNKAALNHLSAKKLKLVEHRHAIRVHSSKNVTIQKLTAINGRGDGIYIGTEGAGPCINVLVDQVRCFSNSRCGLAITACDGFLGTKSFFYSNGGKAPEAGVVIEPHDNSVVDDITFDNCQFYGNASRGFHVVMHVSSLAAVKGITVQNCTMTNNGRKSKDQSTAGIALLRPRLVTITNCTSASNSNGVFILGRRPGDPSKVTGTVNIDTSRMNGNLRDGIIIQNSITRLQVLKSQVVNNSRKKKNTYDGLRIKQGNNVQVTDSIVTGNRYGVYADKHVSGVVLTHTTLKPNKKGAYYAKGARVTVN